MIVTIVACSQCEQKYPDRWKVRNIASQCPFCHSWSVIRYAIDVEFTNKRRKGA